MTLDLDSATEIFTFNHLSHTTSLFQAFKTITESISEPCI